MCYSADHIAYTCLLVLALSHCDLSSFMPYVRGFTSGCDLSRKLKLFATRLLSVSSYSAIQGSPGQISSANLLTNFSFSTMSSHVKEFPK